MSGRVTNAQLEAVVERINRITKSPLESYTVDSAGKYTANIGNFHLDYAYGGVALHRMQSIGGGITDVLSIGHPSKRECLNAMFAFIRGLEHEHKID